MNDQSDNRFGWPVLVVSTLIGSCLAGVCGVVLGLTLFGRLFWPLPDQELSSNPPLIPTLPPPPTLSPLPTLPPTPFVNEHTTFTVYWKRPLWENAISGAVLTEDFEKDESDYGELSFPYITGNEFILTSQSTTAQIFNDGTLLDSGNLIHFRDWGSGLTFSFPNAMTVIAFGFDYRPTETWQLTINDTVITIPKGRRGFVGIVFQTDYPEQFILSCNEGAQGGLSVDNILYVPADSP
ncbi:MAG: hypothetical protein ACT4QE_07100 [Anaerolineales bacterium]